MKRSSVSPTRRFTYFLILCYALARWTRTHNQILSGKTCWRGSRVHHNTGLWTQLMVSQWSSSEYFPRIHHIAALQQSPRVSVKKERKARRIYRTDHLHVDVQRHLMEISRQWTGMWIKRQPRFYLCEKIFTRKIVIPRTWIRKEVVF